MFGRRETETLILAKDSGKQFTSGGSSVLLRGGEDCCPLLDTHSNATPGDFLPSVLTHVAVLLFCFHFALQQLYFFMVCRVGVGRFNEREALNKLRRDREAEGRYRQLLL